MNRYLMIPFALTIVVCLVVGIIIGYFANGGNHTNQNNIVPTATVFTVTVGSDGRPQCLSTPGAPYLPNCTMNTP